MQQPPHHTPPTEIVSLLTVAQGSAKKIEDHLEKALLTTKQDVTEYNKQHMEQPLKFIEDKIQHLKQLVDDTINENILKLEKKITEQIVLNATKEELRELKKELSEGLRRLEDRCSEDFKIVSRNFIYFGLGITVTAALILMASYS